jgi:hypothetical protein
VQECRATKVFALLKLKDSTNSQPLTLITRAAFHYYSEKYGLSYEELLPNSTVVAGGKICPNVIWLSVPPRRQVEASGSVETIIHDYGVIVNGSVEIKRFGRQILLFVK